MLYCLHGALGAASSFAFLPELLGSEFEIKTFDFEGHGGAPLPRSPLTITRLLDQLETFLASEPKPVDIFGYSMGGYVALKLAARNPTKIRRIFTLATKFDWSEQTLEKELRGLNPEIVAQKVPKFAESLAKTHAPTDWRTLMTAVGGLLTKLVRVDFLTEAELKSIQIPVQLNVGDRDRMVSIEETVGVYRQLSQARFSVLPNTPHPIEQVNLNILKVLLIDFFKS